MTYILVTLTCRITEWSAAVITEWSAAVIIEWSAAVITEWSSAGLAVTALRLRQSGLITKKLLSEAILVVIRPNFDSSFSKPDRFRWGPWGTCPKYPWLIRPWLQRTLKRWYDLVTSD